MITDYNRSPADIDASLTGKNRLELIDEALEALAMATDALKKVVRDELAGRHESKGTNEGTVTAIYQLGNQVIKIAQETLETNEATEHTISPDTTDAVVRPRKPSRPYKKDKHPIPLNNRYYSRVLPAEELPLVEYDEGVEPIEIEITSDNTINFNDEEITLEGDGLYIFNAFMRLRDEESITASMLRQYGFRMEPSTTATTTVSIAIRRLREQLQYETDSGAIELISKQGSGGGTTYSVNPAAIKTGVVREGSTITVEYPDEGNYSETFRIPNRYKQPDKDNQTQTLSPELPIVTEALGKRPGDEFNYSGPDNTTVKVRVVGIN